MYLRETKRTNSDGRTVSYLQLAHNHRDPMTGVPKAEIIHSFGRADRVDREGLARLVRSISRFLEPGEAVAASTTGEVEVVDSRPLGGVKWPRQNRQVPKLDSSSRSEEDRDGRPTSFPPLPSRVKRVITAS